MAGCNNKCSHHNVTQTLPFGTLEVCRFIIAILHYSPRCLEVTQWEGGTSSHMSLQGAATCQSQQTFPKALPFPKLVPYSHVYCSNKSSEKQSLSHRLLWNWTLFAPCSVKKYKLDFSNWLQYAEPDVAAWLQPTKCARCVLFGRLHTHEAAHSLSTAYVILAATWLFQCGSPRAAVSGQRMSYVCKAPLSPKFGVGC